MNKIKGNLNNFLGQPSKNQEKIKELSRQPDLPHQLGKIFRWAKKGIITQQDFNILYFHILRSKIFLS